jgi:hypothetical protein
MKKSATNETGVRHPTVHVTLHKTCICRLMARAGNFSLHHRVQIGSGAHPASYPMATRDTFAGGKAAGS